MFLFILFFLYILYPFATYFLVFMVSLIPWEGVCRDSVPSHSSHVTLTLPYIRPRLSTLRVVLFTTPTELVLVLWF